MTEVHARTEDVHDLMEIPGHGRKDIPKGQPRAAIAVVIPFYNQVDKLARTAASLVAQDLRPSIVVFVDDRGDERIAPAILESLSSAGIEVKMVVNKRNLGPGGSRQAGFECVPSDTEFVLFLDSDDHVSDRFLSSSVFVHRSRPDVIATFSDSVNSITGVSRIDVSPPPSHLLDGILKKRPWGTGALLWKYAQISGLRWNSWKFIEDTHFELSAAIVNPRIAFVPDAVLYIDQDFGRERMNVRNRVHDKRKDFSLRRKVFERILTEYPFDVRDSGSRRHLKSAAYHLSLYFTEGPGDYMRCMLGLLTKGRIAAAAFVSYRFPTYLRNRRRLRSKGI